MKAETLKKSILQYAMQGKLVAQDPNDEPASELLKCIKAEKEQFIKDGKIKKEKPLPPIKEEEIPYELPKGWEWCRLGELSIINGGYAFKSQEYINTGIRVVRISDFDEKGFKKDKIVYYKENEKYDDFILGNNDILLAMTGGTVGKSYYVENLQEKMYVNQRVADIKISIIVNSKYINYLILSPLTQDKITSCKNSTNDNISMQDIKEFYVPLPPLAEQERIVEKLEEILPLVEEYGKNEEILSEMNKKLPKQIRQSILQYAVQGKLVEQNPNDEPASELLKRIKAEKEQLIKDGKIKKEKPLPSITADEITYELPQNWEWVRIGTITDIGTGTTPQTSNHEYYDGNINWISSSATGNDYITEPDKLISEKAVKECNLRIYNPDTLIIALYGQGKTRGQITQLKIQSCINQACAAICIINKDLLNLSYVKYFYKKQYNDIRSLAAGGAQPNLNVQKIKNTLIPLPPLAEQQRIVAKVEELMKIVDNLEC